MKISNARARAHTSRRACMRAPPPQRASYKFSLGAEILHIHSEERLVNVCENVLQDRLHRASAHGSREQARSARERRRIWARQRRTSERLSSVHIHAAPPLEADGEEGPDHGVVGVDGRRRNATRNQFRVAQTFRYVPHDVRKAIT